MTQQGQKARSTGPAAVQAFCTGRANQKDKPGRPYKRALFEPMTIWLAGTALLCFFVHLYAEAVVLLGIACVHALQAAMRCYALRHPKQGTISPRFLTRK